MSAFYKLCTKFNSEYEIWIKDQVFVSHRDNKLYKNII